MREFEKMIVKENHEYRVQNQSLQLLGDTFETPFYLYDLDLIAKQYKSLYQYIPWPALKIHYAMKANYNKDILLRLREANACLDAVSPAEVLLALSLGFKAESIILVRKCLCASTRMWWQERTKKFKQEAKRQSLDSCWTRLRKRLPLLGNIIYRLSACICMQEVALPTRKPFIKE